MKNVFTCGLAAGLLVGIGGTVFLACESRYVGAIFFSVALLSICMLGMYLYTGKIGIFAEDMKKPGRKILTLTVGLFGNYIGATLCGIAVGYAKPAYFEKAVTACTARLEQKWYFTVLLGLLCGVLMYCAVKSYAKTGNALGIIFCVTAFILCGFEHSIADMFYFAAARMFNLRYLLFIVLVVIGNTLGGMLVPLLISFGAKKNAKDPEKAEKTEAPRVLITK